MGSRPDVAQQTAIHQRLPAVSAQRPRPSEQVHLLGVHHTAAGGSGLCHVKMQISGGRSKAPTVPLLQSASSGGKEARVDRRCWYAPTLHQYEASAVCPRASTHAVSGHGEATDNTGHVRLLRTPARKHRAPEVAASVAAAAVHLNMTCRTMLLPAALCSRPAYQDSLMSGSASMQVVAGRL